VTVPNPQIAHRLHLAFKDMQDAMRYLDAYTELARMQEERGDTFFADHCEAILCAAIIAYCRPFKKSQSKGQAAANIAESDLDAVSRQPDLHKLLLTKRDKFIAHADWEARSTAMVRIGDDAVLRYSTMPSVHKDLGIDEFRELVKNVGYECRRKSREADFANGAG
jgi:hypothetical protein